LDQTPNDAPNSADAAPADFNATGSVIKTVDVRTFPFGIATINAPYDHAFWICEAADRFSKVLAVFIAQSGGRQWCCRTLVIEKRFLHEWGANHWMNFLPRLCHVCGQTAALRVSWLLFLVGFNQGKLMNAQGWDNQIARTLQNLLLHRLDAVAPASSGCCTAATDMTRWWASLRYSRVSSELHRRRLEEKDARDDPLVVCNTILHLLQQRFLLMHASPRTDTQGQEEREEV
jgi:hypothetical protein